MLNNNDIILKKYYIVLISINIIDLQDLSFYLYSTIANFVHLFYLI